MRPRLKIQEGEVVRRVSVIIPASMLRALDKIADRMQVARQAVILTFLQEQLDDRKK